MFGYINVNRKQLSKEDAATYQQYYCGLCQKLKDIAGIKGQFLLNYDLTFLSILLNSLYELDNADLQFRCPIHPFSCKKALISDATEYAAVLDVILSYHNLLDNYEDDNSKLSKLCAASLKSKYDEIKDTYQKQVLIIENYITSLKVAESRGETSIDIVSNLTGECLSKLFCWKDDIFSKDLSTLGFYLGKFIYIMDAYEDLDKDEKNHKFNQ